MLQIVWLFLQELLFLLYCFKEYEHGSELGLREPSLLQRYIYNIVDNYFLWLEKYFKILDKNNLVLMK